MNRCPNCGIETDSGRCPLCNDLTIPDAPMPEIPGDDERRLAHTPDTELLRGEWPPLPFEE